MLILQATAIIIAFLAITEQASGRCFCDGLKENFCSCRESIPRPQTRPTSKEGTSKAFKSIGSICSCGHTLVRPATPPKPLCKSISLGSSQQTRCHEKTVRAPDMLQGAKVLPNFIYGKKLEDKPVVADAVSLSLAYQLAQNLRQPVPEDKIQYGFQIEPVNNLDNIPQKNIAEEELWSVNRAVVELKTGDISENSESQDEEEIEIRNTQAPGYLTYRDIGYCPENQSTKGFNLKIPSFSVDQLCVNNAESISDKRCGFKPGKVVQAGKNDFGNNIHRGLEDCLEKL